MRIQAETKRVEAEKDRASAETARAQAEQTRSDQETTRQQQEQARQQASSQAVANANAAAQAVMDQVNSLTFALNPADKGLDVTYTYDTETE